MMSITPIDSSAVSTETQPSASAEILGKDDFLNLLVAQLQHQDPLNPAESTEFTAQLAQFSSLEQLGNVNDNLKQLQDFQASINNSQAVTLIGKEITGNGNSLNFADGQPTGCEFKLDGNANVVVVSIYDHTGEFVRSFENQSLAAGHHNLYWDGIDQNGNAAAPGSYTFEVLAAGADGNNIKTTTFFNGQVNKVVFENNTTYLMVGDKRVALGDIIEVGSIENLTESQSITE